ncbi:MAG: citrate/2-methylcitrate synthase, partial [Lachnospiraceae bacterium]|nr:citrate/2-methylcitrate synthase [Lachnospiraceae bacterium]MDY4165251.1 citrate/2-methylcitrate synthase [Lachnospiraceae bacterium]
MPSSYSKITPEIEQLAELTKKASYVNPELYTEYGVKRGLRDINGKGVLVGITNISEVNSQRVIDGKNVPIPGELYYRGYNVADIVKNIKPDNHFGFEEITYLLLFGELPTRQQLNDFIRMLSSYRTLPKNFVRDSILKKPSSDMMNSL